jgi:hypothetical protein
MIHPKVVLCMKWGTIYPAEYVNVLFHACQKNISSDFRFVCLTNEPEGIDPDVEVFPIPDIGLDEWHYYNGAWPKISVFKSDLYGLKGRCLFIDLDTVILGNLDPLFEMKGPLIAINNSPWTSSNLPPRTMSSVFAFDIGNLGSVVDRLQSDRDAIIEKFKIEQQYLHEAVKDIAYWPQEWLVSFKYHLRQPLLVDRFRPPKKPAETVKLVIFHGKPRPIDLVFPPQGNWDRFPHYGSGVVDWMQVYWRENSIEI